MRRSLYVLGLVAGLGLVAERAAAQSTGMPVSLPPVRSFETYALGATVSDPGPGVAVEGWYDMVAGPGDITFRLGIWDNNQANTVFLAGADYRQPLVAHTESFPLDGSLTVGAGGSFTSGNSVFLVPIGFTMGRKFEVKDSNIRLQPYGQPIVHLAFGDTSDNFLFSVGLGLEIQFNEKFALDVNGALGDIDGISIAFGYLR
jgi:hypothetical protein